jgi:hypothetical protein
MQIRGTDFVYYQTGDIEKSIEFYRDTLSGTDYSDRGTALDSYSGRPNSVKPITVRTKKLHTCRFRSF